MPSEAAKNGDIVGLTVDPIEPITETFFRPFDVATLAQLCPDT